MIIKRFYDEKLAQASYLIACGAKGEAVVVDANRDLDVYIRAAEEEEVRVTHVTETHIHADYLSGSRELAARTGAKLLLSGEGDADWKYRFAAEASAALLHDGDSFSVGNVELTAMHSPGHTPEHLSFLVSDRAVADEAMGIVTGDFVFVGDVGRPDLLERAAGVEETMEAGARTLFHSLQEFKSLPDHLQIWPGHGAGSACGKGLSSVPSSTVGYERRFNYAFQITSEEEFVEEVLKEQPEPPGYFALMKRLNRDGPPLSGGSRRPQRLPGTAVERVLASGAPIIDTRPADAYAAGHIAGTINIPLVRSFTTWAGSLIPYDRDFHLLVDERCGDCVEEAMRDLLLIGLDRVAGYFGSEAIDVWGQRDGKVETIERVGVEDVATAMNRADAEIIDVRGQAEWDDGHIPGARHIYLADLDERLDALPRDRDLIVHCQTGGRSAIAASILRAAGFGRVLDFQDGFAGWEAAGRAVV